MTDPSIPERRLTQRMVALEEANKIRSYRAALKRDIKAGRQDVLDLLSNPPEMIMTMKIYDLLMAVPKLGRSKVAQMLSTTQIPLSKQIDTLTERQINDLVYLLKRRGLRARRELVAQT